MSCSPLSRLTATLTPQVSLGSCVHGTPPTVFLYSARNKQNRQVEFNRL